MSPIWKTTLLDSKKKISCNRPTLEKGSEENGELFRQLANTAQAFTVDKDGNPKFTLKLLDDEYLLLGDDRIVSKDSRRVGAFKKEQIKGQAVFRLWPIYPFKTY